MKISQYNWSWWFVSTLIIILIGLVVGMGGKTKTEELVANTMMIAGLISLIPCLYVGCKPIEEKN